MECRCPLSLPRSSTRRSVVVPCSQCLHCRINRRDYVTTRAYLESQGNMFGQFWTLTLSDEGLATFEEKGPRRLYKTFLNSIRNRELRRGNPIPVRSFGVLEYGSTLGRPHFHVLLWNHINSAMPETPYIETLPRPLYGIGPWPHGHVDICPLNVNSMRYVAKYVTVFDQIEDLPRPIAFHPRKPKLGYYGLVRHLEEISRGPAKRWEQQPIISIDGKDWPLGPEILGDWLWHCKRLGLRTVLDQGKDAYRLAKLEEKAQWTFTRHEAQLRKEDTKKALYDHQRKIRDAKTGAMLQRALDYAARKAVASPWPTNPTVITTVQPDSIRAIA